MLNITQVCIICSDLSKFHWHTEGVAGNKKKKGEKKKSPQMYLLLHFGCPQGPRGICKTRTTV